MGVEGLGENNSYIKKKNKQVRLSLQELTKKAEKVIK